MESTKSESSLHCLNCTAPLSAGAKFCASCGQKYTTGRVTFKQLIFDFFDNIFNLDSRIFLTLRKSLIPGFLTEAYFQGRHKTYMHPFRIFLIALIAMVASISWALNDGIVVNGDIFSRMSNARVRKNLMQEVDSLNQLYKNQENPSPLSIELDSLQVDVSSRGGLQGDSIDLDRFFTIMGEDFPPVQIDDAFNLDADELIEKYEIKGLKNQFILRQKIKVMRDSRSFLRFLIGRLSWMALILMPFLALALKLFYWRRGFYYVEHFIFSIHVHSMMFILVAIQALSFGLLPVWSIVITGIVAALYVLLAMRRFYRQGWIKTLIKFSILFTFVYWMLISLSLTLALTLGIILF